MIRMYSKVLKNLDRYLLVALAFLLPYERIPSMDVFGVTLRLSFIVAGLLILRSIYLVQVRRTKNLKLNFTTKTLAAFLIWVALTGLFAINIGRAAQVIVFIIFTAVTALAITVVYEEEYLEDIVKGLLVSAALVALFGAYQYLGNLFGLPNWATGMRERYSWQVFGFPRIQSTALEPLYYCSYLLLPTSIVLTNLLTKSQGRRQNVLLLLAFATSIFLTVSRGGIFALVGMVTFLVGSSLILRTTNLRRSLMVVSLVAVSFLASFLVITYLAKPPVNKEVTGGKKGSAAYTNQLKNTGLEGGGDERAKVRAQALNILKEDHSRYAFGIGAGQFGPYAQNNIKDPTGGWLVVNNLPIEILVELGSIGLGLFAVFILSLVFQAVHTLRGSKLTSSCIVVLAILGYLFAEAIQYQTFSTLYIMHIWVAIGLLMAIVLRNNREGAKGVKNEKPSKSALGRV